MFKKLIAGILISSFSLGSTYASELSEKTNIVRIMNNYITSISCMNDKVQLKDIFTIDKPSENGSIYYVLWNGDIGCNGGTGTHSYYVSEVSRFSPNRPLLVTTNDAFGDNNEAFWNTDKASINYRFIQSMKQVSPSEFEIVSYDYADDKFGGVDQGNMGPANKFSYTVSLVENEGWKITKQVLLEQNK